MQDNYKIKNIIVGYRSEYLNLINELKTLQLFTYIDDEKIKNINFFLMRENNKLGLYCKFDVQKTLLEKIQSGNDFFKDIGVIRRKNGIWTIENQQYKAYVKEENDKYFKNQILKIINLPFVKNTNYGILKNEFIKISFSYLNLSFFTDNIYEYLSYTPYRDKILISNNNFTNINGILNYEIPKNIFNEYEQKIIEKNIDKDITTNIKEVKKYNIFNIEEEPKKLVLKLK